MVYRRISVSTERCVELWDGGQGNSIAEIAETLGCSSYSVRRRLKSAGMSIPRSRASRLPATADQCAALYNDGKGETVRAVAEQLGISYGSAHSRLKEAGAAMAPHGGVRPAPLVKRDAN